MARDDTTDQSEEYKYLNVVDRVGDMPGTNREANVIETVLLDTIDADILSDPARDLGAVSVVDTTAAQIDPATEQTLSSTLSREIATWTAGTLPVEQQTPIEIGTWTAGTLGVEQQTPVGIENSAGTQIDPLGAGDQPLDVSGATVATNATIQNNGEAFASGAALAGGGTLTVGSFGQAGAERIVGQVVSSGAYDVNIDWKDSAGTVIRSETINSGLTGGTWYDVNEQAKSPYADVVIVDTSGASQTVDGTLHVR